MRLWLSDCFLLHLKSLTRLFLTSQSLAAGSALQFVMCKYCFFFVPEKTWIDGSGGPTPQQRTEPQTVGFLLELCCQTSSLWLLIRRISLFFQLLFFQIPVVWHWASVSPLIFPHLHSCTHTLSNTLIQLNKHQNILAHIWIWIFTSLVFLLSFFS